MARNPKFRSPEEVAEILNAFHKSGLSRKDFAKENEIAFSTLGRYILLEKQKNTAISENITNSFIEIPIVQKKSNTLEQISQNVQDEHPNLEVNLTTNHISLSLKGNMSAVFLGALLKEVHGV